ncbi:helix-turn-helix transcriptional regulator [Luteococcus sp. H101]|uniref:helix-turn-helix transcriptional regulator n=1 Tax=unclassified Luteococcus TaxID=2639923 RepID=UPI00406D40A2
MTSIQPAHVPEDAEFLTNWQAASFLGGLSPNTLTQWRADGKGPRFVKLGSRVAYRKQDLRDWAESQVIEPATAKS